MRLIITIFFLHPSFGFEDDVVYFYINSYHIYFHREQRNDAIFIKDPASRIPPGHGIFDSPVARRRKWWPDAREGEGSMGEKWPGQGRTGLEVGRWPRIYLVERTPLTLSFGADIRPDEIKKS